MHDPFSNFCKLLAKSEKAKNEKWDESNIYFDLWALRISQDILTFKNTVFMLEFFTHIR